MLLLLSMSLAPLFNHCVLSYLSFLEFWLYFIFLLLIVLNPLICWFHSNIPYACVLDTCAFPIVDCCYCQLSKDQKASSSSNNSRYVQAPGHCTGVKVALVPCMKILVLGWFWIPDLAIAWTCNWQICVGCIRNNHWKMYRQGCHFRGQTGSIGSSFESWLGSFPSKKKKGD